MNTTPSKFDQASTPDRHQEAADAGRYFSRRIGLQSPNEALQPEKAPTMPPPRPPRRRPTLSALSGFLSFLLLISVGLMFGLVWSEQKMHEPGPLPNDKVVVIVPGTDLQDIIGQLDRDGVIDSPITLNIALLLEGTRSKVKAGEYLFKEQASLRDVMDILVNGRQVLHTVTIAEGLTSQQVVDRLNENDVLVGEIKETPKEGSLLPETYKVVRGTNRSDLIRKMQDDQRRIVDQIWTRRAPDLPLRSPYEMITLASIVEKETGKADERSRVARVFLNRLQKKMKLQSDPTIVYGLVGGKGTLGRPISRAELEKITPYNTYTVGGLPPGPIANPGKAALEAVANPSRTQDLYFVADGTGGHVFSETLDQHVRNVQKWRQIEKEARDKQLVPDADKLDPQTLPTSSDSRPDQHGALISSPQPEAKSVYGNLPSSFPPAVQNQSLMSSAADFVSVIMPPPTPQNSSRTDASGPKRNSLDIAQLPFSARSFSMSPGLDELGIKVRGVFTGATDASLDGPVDSQGSGETQTKTAAIPAPAAPMGSQKFVPEKNAPMGLPNALPSFAKAADKAVEGPADHVQMRAKIIDVSEGTALDPLSDKTYDLNFAKTVPTPKELSVLP